ncbi:hypothetical protein Hanom_Chr03g00205161 [Helianthus anomalus]
MKQNAPITSPLKLSLLFAVNKACTYCHRHYHHNHHQPHRFTTPFFLSCLSFFLSLNINHHHNHPEGDQNEPHIPFFFTFPPDPQPELASELGLPAAELDP